MNRLMLLLLLVAVAGCGERRRESQPPVSKRVIGVGGIFFKSKNPPTLRRWYEAHLGLKTNEYGTIFESRKTDKPEEKGYLLWAPFSESTKYFKPSEKDFMINFRVENLELLIRILRGEGVTVLDTIETFDYGKFAHILDEEGNKIELWEPVDTVYERMVGNARTF